MFDLADTLCCGSKVCNFVGEKARSEDSVWWERNPRSENGKIAVDGQTQ